jgi:hypothetical protein
MTGGRSWTELRFAIGTPGLPRDGIDLIYRADGSRALNENRQFRIKEERKMGRINGKCAYVDQTFSDRVED